MASDYLMAPDYIIYDKAKYHLDSVEEYDLDEDQAYVHTAFYLRWILENKLWDEVFYEEVKDLIDKFQKGEISALEVYRDSGGWLTEIMLNDEGNAFTQFYFVFEKDRYLNDYLILADDVLTFFHVEFTEENYCKIKPLIDKAYNLWKICEKILNHDNTSGTEPSNLSKP